MVNGLQVSQTAALGAVPSNWSVSETGDFNVDSKADILWRESTMGTVATWFMNGLQIGQAVRASVVGNDWQIQGTNAD